MCKVPRPPDYTTSGPAATDEPAAAIYYAFTADRDQLFNAWNAIANLAEMVGGGELLSPIVNGVLEQTAGCLEIGAEDRKAHARPWNKGASLQPVLACVPVIRVYSPVDSIGSRSIHRLWQCRLLPVFYSPLIAHRARSMVSQTERVCG
jgi:hypothetical protein